MSISNPLSSFLILLCLLNLMACQHEADNYAIKGIDVSHYQEKIDWTAVAEQKDLHFVFIKATEGESYQDSTFEYNWAGAGETHLLRGAYHFFRPQVSATQQIKNFTERVKLQSGDLPPVLDIEAIELPNPVLIDKIGKWLMFVEEHYQIKPIIYASVDLYQKHLQTAFPEYIVWIARYNRIAPPEETHWQFWQYSDQERIRGIEAFVDKNVFVGNKARLKDLCLP